MFIYTHLLVGPLLPGQSEKLRFPYTDITIIALAPSCGCSDQINDEVKKEVRVKVTAAGDYPVHLMNKPGYSSDKFIEVTYHTGDPNKTQKMKLTFKLSVTNPNFIK